MSLSIQLMSISMIVVIRQTIHEMYINRNQWNDSYDYVVVGAGASGSAIAHRLSENCRYKVILLEAGGPQHVVTDIPKNSRSLIDSEYDWKYKTVPQNWFTPYRVPQPRGKVFGGSTTISNMIYSRGNRKDFDNWVNTYGAKGWGYRHLLPYFIKSENNTDPYVVNDCPNYHGTRGPVKISSDYNPDPILLIHQKVINDLGIPSIDINGPQQLGTMISQSFISKGLRSSAANEYIESNPQSEYLHILSKAFVTKILFNTYGGKPIATGVEFIKNGIYYSVSARKEVILCAGVFNSPQILMLSGIGPKQHLYSLGIPVLSDLPVGSNLQDHPAISIYMLINNNNLVRSRAQEDIQQLYEVLTEGSGPLSVLTPSIIFNTTSSIRDKQWPNTFTYSLVEYINNLNNTVREMPYYREEWTQYFRPYLNKYVLLSSIHLSRVRSYGTLRLSSANPFMHPIIDPQYLAHPQDYKDLVEKTKFILFLLTETQLSRYLSIFPKPIPGCSYCPNRKLYECDPYIRCLIRETIKSGYNPVGTCRMGNVYRNDVVVDEKLRVKNIGGLRVCDTSVIPQIINSNTNAVAIAIGERAADLIKRDDYFNDITRQYF